MLKIDPDIERISKAMARQAPNAGATRIDPQKGISTSPGGPQISRSVVSSSAAA